jgi:putative Mg2+ transporter-C (MgtC) family protein
MLDTILSSVNIDWAVVVSDFIRVAIAFVLALPIGYERAHASRSLGLRTFPIVAIASCGYMLIVKNMDGATADVMARALQGLLGGIGFIGGGTILKEGGSVYGLATAASIWNTGAIGAAVAFEHIEIAIILSLLNYAVLRVLTPLVALDGYGDEADSEDEEK